MRSTLTIAMIAPFGVRPKGTLSARMLPLAQALVRRGHTVSIVAPAVQNPEDAGTRVEHGGVWVSHVRRSSLPGPAAAADQAARLLFAALEHQPDVVHLFKPKGYGGLAARLGRLLRPDIPLIVDTDDWEGRGGWNDLLPYPGWAKLLFDWQERDLPQQASAVTVVSRTLELQVRGAGVAPDRVFYVPNGSGGPRPETQDQGTVGDGRWTIVTGPRSRGTRDTVLLYTRFWEFDLRMLMAALVGLNTLLPHVRVLVVGKGERGEEQEMLRLAQRAGLVTMIDYYGWARPEEMPGLMAQADVALVPIEDTLINRARGLAKLLELMGSGLPIVASRVGQVAEYLEDAKSGLLVPPDNPGALARGVAKVLGDPQLQLRLRAGAQTRAALFRWDILAATAEMAYHTAWRTRKAAHSALRG